MNLETTLLAYGTPEGSTKGWDTRGRGRVFYHGTTIDRWKKIQNEGLKTGQKARDVATQGMTKKNRMTSLTQNQALAWRYANNPYARESGDTQKAVLLRVTLPDHLVKHVKPEKGGLGTPNWELLTLGKNVPTRYVEKIRGGEEMVEREGVGKVPGLKGKNTEGSEPPQTGAYSARHTSKDKYFDDPSIQADIDGEPGGPAMQHMHIQPRDTFHPPSLVKRGKQTHVPTDDVGETDNKWLDVDKRNSRQTNEDRMKILKRSSPAPAAIPVRAALPSSMMASKKPMLKQRPVNWDKRACQKVSYARRGCM